MTPAKPAAPPQLGRDRSKFSRTLKNRGFAALCIVVASLSVIVLGVLLASIITNGLTHLDTDFLKDSPSRDPEKAGLGPAIWGSIWICGVCAIVALPLGVGTALFLEEYKPKASWLKKLHGFVQLNISNLAGVPSIVYGILGLTAFVQMFGWLGNPNEPAFEIGAKWYDEYVDESGQYLRVPVASRQSPVIELTNGMIAFDDDLNPVTLRIVDVTADAPVESGVLYADAEGFRVDERAPYYLSIPFGRSVLAGGLTLMLVVLPIVIVSSQEALRAVPSSLREAALGLGATKWQTVRRTTLPAAVPGIMTGSILAMSRAIGEAAPILIIAGIVFIRFTPQHLMDEFTAMPLQIFDWAGRPQDEFHRVAATGILVLLSVLLTFNAVAVFIRQKFTRPLQ